MPSHSPAAPRRPHFHFTPAHGWLNDPNGLLFYAGEFHLFYQYHPDNTLWGPMHWGHAVSTDLVNWQHLPIALFPDDLGYIFSGSGVIDWHNTAGFGAEAMVLFFTHHHPDTLAQSQSLAYSLDKGRSWTKYADNPIIPTPHELQNFRDPKVFWYADGADDGHWVMLVATDDAILFYTSTNLLAWEANGRFGSGYGATDGVWETPDLFKLPVGDSADTRWVLSVGVGAGAPAGGSGTQYFVGHFDGKTFTSDHPRETVLWVDFGADFYAAQSWSDTPNGRCLWLAWLNNWQYARDIPAATWRGAMSVPREVHLLETAVGIRLVQKPIPELEQLRSTHHQWHNLTLHPKKSFIPTVTGNTLEIIAEFIITAKADRFGLRVLAGDGAFTTIGYEPTSGVLFTDRSRSGQVDFHQDFARHHQADLPLPENSLRLHIFVDCSMIEVFADNGRVCFSERVFPAGSSTGLAFFADGRAVTLKHLEIFELRTAVFAKAPESSRIVQS